jgi:hypothetical protein
LLNGNLPFAGLSFRIRFVFRGSRSVEDLADPARTDRGIGTSVSLSALVLSVLFFGEEVIDAFCSHPPETSVGENALRQGESGIKNQGIDGIVAGFVPAHRAAVTPSNVVLESRMKDFMRENACELGSQEGIDEVRVVEEGDPVGRHGLDPARLLSLKPEQERTEEGMIQKECGACFLDAD